MTLKHPLEQRTLPAMLARNAETFGDRIFLRDDAGEVTWGGTWTSARQLAGAFARMGVAKGDPVALILGNRRELLESWFGLATLGAIEVPADPDGMSQRLVHVLNHSGARVAVVEADSLETLDRFADQLECLERVVVVGGDGSSGRFDTLRYESAVARTDPLRSSEAACSDPVAILYTSGSTGLPKGAIIPHAQHYINGWQATAAARLEAEDILYLCLPLHHNMAQGYGIWAAIVSGASVQLARRFDRHTFWDDVQRSGATVFPFVGAMLVLLAKQDAGGPDNPLRVGYGVPIPADVHETFERRFGLKLIHCYGSTEATIVSWQSPDERVIGSAGRALPDYEVRIHDDNDLPVGDGGIGEICIRPREPFSCFLGYYRDPERTMEKWRNLWLHTGDAGMFDSEGNLWFIGRRDDLIRCRGDFISPEEIEDVVASHPEVVLAAAYGVPSELTEEDVMIAVVRRPDSQLSAAGLREWAAERLPRRALPRFVDFVPELPMTSTGKIERYKLKERGVTATADDARNAVPERV